MRTAIIDRRRRQRHSDHAKTVCDLTLGTSGRYYRRFIDMSSRRAAEKSFELSQKRHFWTASKSRARRAPPKTSSVDRSWYVGTPHIVYIKFQTHAYSTALRRDEANRERHASPAYYNRFVSLTNCGVGVCVIRGALAQSHAD